MTPRWLDRASPAFRLAIATSWLAPDSLWPHQEQAIQAALDDGPDWQEYLRLLDRHGTPGLGWAALRRISGVAVPDAVAQALASRSDACRKQALVDCLLLAETLKQCNHAAIPAMPLKGPILSGCLYQDPGLRYARDLDLEVRRRDFDAARHCLQDLGWRPEDPCLPVTPRQWESFLRHEHSMGFVHLPSGRLLELHWRNQWESSAATDARWSRSVATLWQDRAIQAMSPADLALYLCGHGAGHLWFRAKWLGDLARAHAIGLLDWQAAWSDIPAAGHRNLILSSLRLLHCVYGLPMPELPASPGRKLPPLLVEMPIRALLHPGVPNYSTSPSNFLYRIQLFRYQHALRPGSVWRESLAELLHSRKDFQTLPLPDTFFWAYKPLRPFLWLWRWLRDLTGDPSHNRNQKP